MTGLLRCPSAGACEVHDTHASTPAINQLRLRRIPSPPLWPRVPPNADYAASNSRHIMQRSRAKSSIASLHIADTPSGAWAQVAAGLHTRRTCPMRTQRYAASVRCITRAFVTSDRPRPRDTPCAPTRPAKSMRVSPNLRIRRAESYARSPGSIVVTCQTPTHSLSNRPSGPVRRNARRTVRAAADGRARDRR